MPSPLLKETPENVPPPDFLLTRVRWRRSELDLSGHSEPWPGRSAEEGLAEAFAWLYARLTRPACRSLQAFLELHAGRTLVHALRLQRAERPETMRHLLENSLLAEELGRDLLAAADTTGFLAVVEKQFGSRCPDMQGLVDAYAEQGPGGAEEQLTAGLLSRAVRLGRNRLVRRLVAGLIDLRNLAAIGKHWRWQVARRPGLVAGGRVETSRLDRLWQSRDEAGLERLVGRLAGAPGLTSIEPRAIEVALLRRLTLMLQRQGRDPLGGGVLLDYLWRCRMAARNRALFIALEADNEHLLDDVMVMP